MKSELGQALGKPTGVFLEQDGDISRISIDNIDRIRGLASDYNLCSGRGIRHSRRPVSEEGEPHTINDQRE